MSIEFLIDRRIQIQYSQSRIQVFEPLRIILHTKHCHFGVHLAVQNILIRFLCVYWTGLQAVRFLRKNLHISELELQNNCSVSWGLWDMLEKDQHGQLPHAATLLWSTQEFIHAHFKKDFLGIDMKHIWSVLWIRIKKDP